ncbi:hypothetical protein B0H15DRAFT_1018848 [Mycena belliarum]|uniref:ubiquitinyl hydrolase 1 n=1 Tax=Mycena belliarum TaxID=1033014 RepID=A0AAD6UDK0_9AGAR|nr:hypothetical protein B0H15DRAFT_1018848 [Mycena belliae]
MLTVNAAVVEQVLPLVVLILVPTLALYCFAFVRPRLYTASMALGALLPWKWGHSGSDVGLSPLENEVGHGKGKARRVRTRADQLSAQNKTSVDEQANFPGLVNMSGTHCFMNSTLQALASLSHLPAHLRALRARAEALDVPTPVTDALLDLLAALNTPAASPSPLRATALVEALCAPPPDMDFSSPSTALAFWASGGGSGSGSGTAPRAQALLASHEHQDAQELFQLVSEAVRDEGARVRREGALVRGFALPLAYPHSALRDEGEDADADATADAGLGLAAGPFDGLTATRRACVRCGYTAAIRHFSFDSVQLALEGVGAGWGGTTLAALLRTYTALEVLHDCPCRRCALRATARRLADEAARLADTRADEEGEKGAAHGMRTDGMLLANGSVVRLVNGHQAKTRETEKENARAVEKEKEKEKPTASRARRLKAVRKMEARVVRALEAGRIEEEELEAWGEYAGENALKGVRIERVPGGVCTRQSMFGRPPAILALHINRSVHTGMRVAKNGARVAFPEVLDLAPYTTGGVMRLEPTAALSGALGDALGGVPPGGADEKQATRDQDACVYRLAAAVCHYGQHAFGHYICYRRAPVADADGAHVAAPPAAVGSGGTGAGWLRISDANVQRCGVEAVLAEGSAVFMLYYERVPPPPPPPVYAAGAEADSAETITPGRLVAQSPSVSTAVSVAGSGSGLLGGSRARVVRSVSVGLGGPGSRAPSLAGGSSSSLSLRSAPATPRGEGGEDLNLNGDLDRSVESLDADGGAVVDGDDDASDNVDVPGTKRVVRENGQDGESGALPTPPPTPKTGAAGGKAKKKKKKKGTGKAAGEPELLKQAEP